jgi:diguanylate cyclase (GGDEF)-like protein
LLIRSVTEARSAWPALAAWMGTSGQDQLLIVPLGDLPGAAGAAAFSTGGSSPGSSGSVAEAGFTEAGFALMSSAASVAGRALERIRVAEVDRRLRAWGDLLARIAARVGASYDAPWIAEAVTGEITRSGLVDEVSLDLALEPIGGAAVPGGERPARFFDTPDAVTRAFPGLPGDPAPPQALALLPLAVNGHGLGSLSLRIGSRRGFPPAEQAFLEALATQCAQALERARLYGRLEAESLTDPLTGLSNRRALDRDLGRALERLARTGRAVALLYLDLNDFKGVNDRYGHQAGDDLLVAVAGRLRAVVRAPATVARLGGDEFVVLAEDLQGAADARTLAQRMAHALDFAVDGGSGPRVSASIGVAVATGAMVKSSALFGAADRAMYAAKRSPGPGPRFRVVELGGVPAGQDWQEAHTT